MDVMKVYLCGRYTRRSELNTYKQQLELNGFTVTSRWLLDKGTDIMLTPRTSDPLQERAHDAELDVRDILTADVIVQFSDEPVEVSPFPNAARGGRHWELGFAFGTGLHCLVVGPRENIFHYLPAIAVVPSWDEGLGWLEERRRLLNLADDDGEIPS